MALQFQSVLHGLRLPENYLPSVFSSLDPSRSGARYPLIPMPLAQPGQQVRQTFPVNIDKLLDPAALSDFMNDTGDTGNFYIGPELSGEQNLSQEVDRSAPPAGLIREPVIGIVDFGIAFWNDRFSYTSEGAVRSRFVDVGFLDFNPHGHGKPGVTFLGQGNLATLLDLSTTPGGESKIVEGLAEQHPNSAYGHHPKTGQLFSVSGFNHGTAMADFAGGRNPLTVAPDKPGPVLFGIELPADAVLDSSGETLQAVLNVAILELMNRVIRWANEKEVAPDLRIVVSYAFLGGPHDGSHPVVEYLESLVWQHPLTPDGVRLFLPTGNHLQDQLHARIQPGETLRWFLSPDDHGPNTVEILMNEVASFNLELTSPGGVVASVSLKPGNFSYLMNGEQKVGAVWCRQIDNGMLKTRLTLGATTPQASGTLLAASGEWRLNMSVGDGREGEIKLWILREDGLGLTRRLAPSRQSNFRDDAYALRRKNGTFLVEDDLTRPAKIRRRGTSSLLATGNFSSNKPVGAQQKTARTSPGETAWYSGQFADDSRNMDHQLVDDGRPGLGSLACGNGGPRKFRVSGTSVAAAKQARKP